VLCHPVKGSHHGRVLVERETLGMQGGGVLRGWRSGHFQSLIVPRGAAVPGAGDAPSPQLLVLMSGGRAG